jgi:hypothetical protein
MVGGLIGHNPLLGYRLPETNVRWWSVDIDPDTFMVVGTGQRLWLSGSVEPCYYLLRINEREYVSIASGLSAASTISKGYSVQGGPSFDADVDWYPTRMPVSVGTHSHVSGQVRHEQEPGYLAFDDPQVWVPGYKGNSWSVRTESELGPAFGRLRDATPVLQALLIGEALAKENVLAAPVGEDAVQALARALASGSQVYYSHDANRGTKFFYAELERVLVAKGCITGRLPARVWLRIREIVGHQPLLDDRSWLTGAKLSVRGGISAYLERLYYNREGQRGADTTAYANLSGLATFEFGYPFTTRLHLSGDAQAHQGPRIGHQDATAKIALAYLLPDRMQVSIRGQCQLIRDNPNPAEEPAQTYQSASAGVVLITYVEDRSTLAVGISCQERAWQSGTSSPWQPSWGLGCNVSLRRYF